MLQGCTEPLECSLIKVLKVVDVVVAELLELRVELLQLDAAQKSRQLGRRKGRRPCLVLVNVRDACARLLGDVTGLKKNGRKMG